MSFILLVACTFLVYLAEKSDDQPGKEPEAGELGNLGDGLYWGIVSEHIYQARIQEKINLLKISRSPDFIKYFPDFSQYFLDFFTTFPRFFTNKIFQGSQVQTLR